MKRRLALALALAMFAPAAAHAIPFRAVALSGQPAPETPAGILFNTFTHAVINQSGDVAFNAVVAGPGVTAAPTGGSTGIWATHSGGTRKVARSGDPHADAPGGVIVGGHAKIDGHGRVAFIGGIGGNVWSVWSEGAGFLRGVSSLQAAGPGFNANGNLAFLARHQLSGREGIWTDISGDMMKVVEVGDLAPGFDGFSISYAEEPSINDNGVILFGTTLQNSATGDVKRVVWKYEGGALSSLGESSWGRTPRINNAGQVLLERADGIYRYREGMTELVAQLNVQAPDAAPGERLTFINALRINGVGDATFFGQLSRPIFASENQIALWTERNGQIEIVAREGMQAPGVAAGGKFRMFYNTTNPDLAVNSAGQVAFAALLWGSGANASNDAGIWATDLTGTLRKIVRSGDLFDVNDDPLTSDFRTISAARIARPGGGGQDGWNTSFNDAGELVATLNFTDGTSGVFVFATAVPEPQTLAMVGLALCGAPFLRRARLSPRSMTAGRD